MYQYHDLAFSPVLLTQFNNDLTDASGNSFDLSLDTGLEQYADIEPGLRGFLFDGSTELFRSAFESTLNITGDVTVEMLIKVGTLLTGGALRYVVVHTAGTGETEVENTTFSSSLTNTNTQVWLHEESAGTDQQYGIVNGLIPNVTYHWAAVRESNVIQFYLNGSSSGAASSALTAPTGGTTGRLRIGGDTGAGTNAFQGVVASVKVVDRALTAAEVARDANYTLFGVESADRAQLPVPVRDVYSMRAFHSLSSSHVYWESLGGPDEEGAFASFPINELNGIVIHRRFRR